MNKNAEYYLSLKYIYVIKKVHYKGEVFYQATHNELDKYAFYGVGSTPREAKADLDEVKKDLFSYYVNRGYEINEPDK